MAIIPSPPLTLLSSLARVANLLIGFANSKHEANARVFKEVIEPTYKEMHGVAHTFVNQYESFGEHLERLHNIYCRQYCSEYNYADYSFNHLLKKYVSYPFDYEGWRNLHRPNCPPCPPFLNRQGKENHADSLFNRHFCQAHADELISLSKSFCHFGEKHKDERIKVDATAAAIEHKYEGFNNDFAENARVFAYHVRIIAGRDRKTHTNRRCSTTRIKWVLQESLAEVDNEFRGSFLACEERV